MMKVINSSCDEHYDWVDGDDGGDGEDGADDDDGVGRGDGDDGEDGEDDDCDENCAGSEGQWRWRRLNMCSSLPSSPHIKWPILNNHHHGHGHDVALEGGQDADEDMWRLLLITRIPKVVVVTATRNNDDGIVQDDEEASARKFMIL